MGKNVESVVTELAEPIVASYDLELVDVEYNKEGPDWILRVFVDNIDGVSLDDCQQVSRDLSEQLDLNDPIEQSYLLEVSSPGIDRPLKTKQDFERFSGELVEISTYAPVNGEKELTGKLLGLEEENVKISLDGEELSIPLSKIAKTKLAVEF
ncbi:ribosome maturation factor RimP [Natroniella sulfidigena]|uniref:ribosome maturation factor RimP n=1 Tax=Natroniella sulfidigena TaxID=723921 RepID=UPI00200A974E|nr:ribosome maturation factor RimP [Natroniella sulfidigena]MCK8816484.1 ribosome maturation factor RimP [Natroniella sulfidigena]